MWKNKKFRFHIIIFFLLVPRILFAENFYNIKKFQSAKDYYDLKIPSEIHISIEGEEYIKFLKQIEKVGKKENLNSNLVNSHEKKWIKANINSNEINIKKTKAKIILHGDFNDHISIPYSSFRVNTGKNFFYQLKNFILFKPKTRRYEAEIFGSLFLKNIGILAPYSRYVKVSINNNLSEDYIFQEKITKFLIERKGFREGPILEYDEKNKWNNLILNLPHFLSENFYKLENENFAKNNENIEKIFIAASLKQTQNKKNMVNDFFETSLLLLGGCHGLADHNRKYYFDILNEDFLPIYYDGMLFYDKSNRLCEAEREDYKISLSKETIENIENIIYDNTFKDKLEYEFYEGINRNNKKIFKEFWNYLENNIKKYKELINESKNLEIKDLTISKKKIIIENKLKNLNLPYPTIFYFKDLIKNEYNICYKWFDLKNDIYLIKSKKKIIKKNQGCKKINKNKILKLLKNEIYYKTNLSNKIKIYPILVGNVYNNALYTNIQKPIIETINVNKENFLKEYNLKKNQILRLNISKNFNIDKLIINSSNQNNSALILNLNGNMINSLEFNQNANLDKTFNTNINKKNITGCLNIYDSNFIINQININGSKCEDGLNIVRSTGIIKSLNVKDALSDGVDFDYSDIQVDSSNFFNINGDCIDLSFGKYKIKNSIINRCGDKGISAGENSIVSVDNTIINNSSIGVASKDNSRVTISNMTLNNVKNCLAAYNKKPEFGGGHIKYTKLQCTKFDVRTAVDNVSVIHD